MRGGRRRRLRHGGAYSRAGGRRGHRRRSAGVPDAAGPRAGFGAALRGPRRAPTEGSPREMAALCRRLMTEVDPFVEFAHDLRGDMGSLRRVISSLLDEDAVECRRVLHNLVEEEVQRVAVTASALPALALAASDRA